MNGVVQSVRELVDAIGQSLTSAPLWLQAPLVMIVVIPLCGVLALAWLRIVDVLGAMGLRVFHALSAKVGTSIKNPGRENPAAGHEPEDSPIEKSS